MFYDLEQNLENAYGWVYVHPQHRGSGYGRELAAPMFDTAEENGRTRFGFTVNEGRPEEALTRRAGMRSAYREQTSRLQFQEVDWRLMGSWVARAAERASDYELIFLPSPIEDRHLAAYCELMLVMNTAPLEDLEEEHEVITPDNWRDIEAKMKLRGIDILTFVARHKPTGEMAGYTNVGYHSLQPDLVGQMDTGVDPKHRDKGLGRWIKAAMALKLRDEYPQVRRIDTENAGSNQPMLNINIEMGFKPVLVQNVWQGDLATIRRNLSV
jgi:GNAT superfamily N-acetyltransferase